MISNGIDLVQISRFDNIINNDIVMKSIFNDHELEYIKKHKKLDTAAGIYAAKEAFLKAIKKGINNYSLKDIEVIHDNNNAPSIILHNDLKKDYSIDNISLSISHDGDYAIAIVLITI